MFNKLNVSKDTDYCFDNAVKISSKVIKPKSIANVNQDIFSVDRQDQLLLYFIIMYRLIKGIKKLCFYLMDFTICNSLSNAWEKKSK